MRVFDREKIFTLRYFILTLKKILIVRKKVPKKFIKDPKKWSESSDWKDRYRPLLIFLLSWSAISGGWFLVSHLLLKLGIFESGPSLNETVWAPLFTVPVVAGTIMVCLVAMFLWKLPRRIWHVLIYCVDNYRRIIENVFNSVLTGALKTFHVLHVIVVGSAILLFMDGKNSVLWSIPLFCTYIIALIRLDAFRAFNTNWANIEGPYPTIALLAEVFFDLLLTGIMLWISCFYGLWLIIKSFPVFIYDLFVHDLSLYTTDILISLPVLFSLIIYSNLLYLFLKERNKKKISIENDSSHEDKLDK